MPKRSKSERRNITQAFVDRVRKAKPGERDEYFDSNLPGFALRVSDQGGKVFTKRFHFGDQQIRLQWPCPPYTLADARARAIEAADKIKRGEDPRIQKAAPEAPVTVKAVGELFVQRYAKVEQKRSWAETERVLDKNVYPNIGAMRIADVRRHHVIDLLDNVADVRTVKLEGSGATVKRGGPMAARNAHKALRKLFRWAHEDRGSIEANPIAGLKAPASDVKRKRNLSDDEIRALWRVWSQPSPYCAACKLMLLSAQRVHEASKIARGEIDADGNWLILAERYKTGFDQVVPLSEATRALLDEQKAVEGSDLYFTLSGEVLNGWSNAKAWMDQESGVTDWQLRDLRRTAKTLMSRHGVRPDISERVLGHVIPGVAGVYDRYEYLDEKRDALKALAGAVARIINPPPNNIVPIKKAAQP